jgi:hypothetical protein
MLPKNMARPESRVDIEHVVLGLHYHRHIGWSMTCVREMRRRRTKGSTITYLDAEGVILFVTPGLPRRIAFVRSFVPTTYISTYIIQIFMTIFCGQLCSSSNAASSNRPRSYSHYPIYFDHLRILSSRRKS